MKTKFILFIFVLALASCATSKAGCPGSKQQGPKTKYSNAKFKWY